MKTYYVKVNAEEELGDDNYGFIFGLYWYDDPTGNNFLNLQWFKTEQERTDFIAKNEMSPIKFTDTD